jgi:PhoPQ-activated pathogenicity-related protein
MFILASARRGDESRAQQWRRLGGILVLGVTALCAVGVARADLLGYVKKPDAAFRWEVRQRMSSSQGTIYDLHLVSQVWQGIQWEHQLQVYQPRDVAPNSTLLLWNTGGNAKPESMKLAMDLAGRIQAPVAFLYNIPNQPLLGDKTEDALIAETFVRYLNTRDENWPLLFPMVKSVVRAMDALQAFSEQEWKKKAEKFIVTGASKRGWTSWLTGAADSRVTAIAPFVIDTLNMKKQNVHQREAFGTYSEEIDDYTKRGLVPMPETREANRLWSMVDPYFYRDRLAMPKLLVNGNNDPYWTADALNLYWDGLKGPKWVTYVPNAGHNLQEHHADGHKDNERAIGALAAFARAQITGQSLPRLKWQHSGDNGSMRLTVEADPPPSGARLWQALAPTQDFRRSPWTEHPVKIDGGTIVGEAAAPAEGYSVFYIELDYSLDGLPYHLSTQVRVAGKSAEPGK